jgi:hypothetical protein
MAQVNRIGREAAENMAVQALAYLAGEPEQLARFLALSGIGPDTIRSAAGDPQFLAGVLDYVAGEEKLLSLRSPITSKWRRKRSCAPRRR